MEMLSKDLQDKVSEGYAATNNYFRQAESYITEQIKTQADELVQLGLNGVRKAEGFFDVPLWGSLVGAVDYNIKDYLTGQLQTELIQRHPEINQLGGEEYAKIINMSNDIMYPVEKMTLQQFWDEWEEKLEDAIKKQSLVEKDREIVETRGYGFTKETATKPYKPVAPSKDSIEFQVQDIPEVDPTPRTWSDEFLASKEPNVNLKAIPDKIIPSEMQASSSPKRFNLFKPEFGQAPTPKQDELNPTLYTVKGGDTLSKIAKEYGVSVEEIARANNIKKEDLDRIYPDQKIRIPIPYSKDALKYTMESLEAKNVDKSEINKWVAGADTDAGENIADFKRGLKMSDFVQAVLEIETSGGIGIAATSPVGAVGLMQIMPYTAKLISDNKSEWTTDKILYDPKTNFLAGIWLLRDNFKKIKRSKNLNREQAFWASIALYNWGWGKRTKSADGDSGYTKFRGVLDKQMKKIPTTNKNKNPESYFNELPEETQEYFIKIDKKLKLGKNFKTGK